VSLKLKKERTGPPKLNYSTEEIRLRADALFQAEQSKDLRDVIAEKIGELRHYDVLAMERVAAILMWGRSGSLLLATYLDGHEDVLMLPEASGHMLYDFFECYPSMPLRDKLIGYATLEYHRFFEGDFGISPAQYYAAVQAILESCGKWPPDFLESRRAFFLFVHIAYNMALGRRRVSSDPLIVFAQHWLDNRTARHLVEDFPQTTFVHAVRDPISSCNRMYHLLFGAPAENTPRTLLLAPYMSLFYLIDQDRPHFGMESRTRAVRFEDTHSDLAGTMRDLADWLRLPYQTALLDSTFNGVPWVVKRDGKTWSGPRLEQVERSSHNLSRKDRALLFALFYENFVAWNYSCSKIFRHLVVRCIVFVSLFAFPTKMEIMAARTVLKRWSLPALRRGNIAPLIETLLGIGFCRLRIIWLLAPAFFRRCVYGTTLLQLDLKSRPLERDDNVLQSTT
jgi:hypothetical protein